MPTLCSTKLSLSPTPSQPHRRQGAPPWPIPGCRLSFGVPVSPLAPIPGTLGVFAHPWGCLWDTQVPERRGSVGPGVGVLLPTQGFPGRAEAGPRKGSSTAGSPPRWLPFQGSTELLGCPAPRTGVEQARLASDRAAPVGALGQGEDGPSRVPMRWPRSGEPPALSPDARGQRSLPGALSPSLPASRPCRAAPAVPAAACARLGCLPGPGWALPPLARHLEAPPEAARLSGPREPAPGPWDGCLGAGAPRDEEGRLFLCSIPCKSGLGWALPGRTSCVCCLLITGSVSEQTGGRGGRQGAAGEQGPAEWLGQGWGSCPLGTSGSNP